MKKKFFKLVCGAGNEDCETVKRLVHIYSQAGCKVFDISARTEILEAAKQGCAEEVYFCVSAGIKGDPHISKAEIAEQQCIKCGNCLRSCPNGAVSFSYKISEKKCIGCKACLKSCPVGAINMYEKDVDCGAVLPVLVQNGAAILELHVTGNDREDLDKKWKVINECSPKLASICIDRENLSNREILARIKGMISCRAPYTTIIQADGVPMSGSNDSYKTTLQAAATAEIIQDAALPVYLVISGGTNSKTGRLCRLCGIDYNGIAIGSWGRKIVSDIINRDDFWQNETVRYQAVCRVRKLINSCFPTLFKK